MLAILASLACSASQPSADPQPKPQPQAQDPIAAALAVVEEADRLSAVGLWPGFDPRRVPIAIFDGERTLLLRHPSPPVEFTRLPGHDAWMIDGRHRSVSANSSAEIGGVQTATLMPAAGDALRDRAATLIHEIFHVHQRANHPGWSANEVELFTYPAGDAALLALRRTETEALRRAVAAPAAEPAACWARAALATRMQRYGRMSAGAAEYERKSELNEGLAEYVARRATGELATVLPSGLDFPPDGVRHRAYRTGAAFGALLDRFGGDWRGKLAATDSLSLDGMLGASLPAPRDVAASCALTAVEHQRLQSQAEADIAELRSRRAQERLRYASAPGWQLVIDASAAPLFPQGFDPLNVQVMGDGEVLHTRFLKLGNAAGSLEVLGRSSLTTGAGAHPLFNGVRRLLVTGLGTEPRVQVTDGVARFVAEQLSGELRNAAVERDGTTITVRLRGGS